MAFYERNIFDVFPFVVLYIKNKQDRKVEETHAKVTKELKL